MQSSRVTRPWPIQFPQHNRRAINSEFLVGVRTSNVSMLEYLVTVRDKVWPRKVDTGQLRHFMQSGKDRGVFVSGGGE